jgi:hypothetical protein
VRRREGGDRGVRPVIESKRLIAGIPTSSSLGRHVEIEI